MSRSFFFAQKDVKDLSGKDKRDLAHAAAAARRKVSAAFSAIGRREEHDRPFLPSFQRIFCIYGKGKGKKRRFFVEIGGEKMQKSIAEVLGVL